MILSGWKRVVQQARERGSDVERYRSLTTSNCEQTDDKCPIGDTASFFVCFHTLPTPSLFHTQLFFIPLHSIQDYFLLSHYLSIMRIIRIFESDQIYNFKCCIDSLKIRVTTKICSSIC